ncbi:MAG: hypothetical protein DI533_21655 [Cereibacter sphaeroides]|uniref:Uncharacterized protein n=1 Tax=Cereibacter sphaeroides TaxID=1063 RepID=A0A2W5U9Q7_CERSP|nr:MAG: hypothetical protein DI533_21655 [Cereibacter sphaeroides]
MTTTATPAVNEGPPLDPKAREFEYGGHVFVWARPRHKPWRHFDGTTSSLKRHDFEFRPCMLSGYEAGRRLYIIGSTYAYDIADFEISEDAVRP